MPSKKTNGTSGRAPRGTKSPSATAKKSGTAKVVKTPVVKEVVIPAPKPVQVTPEVKPVRVERKTIIEPTPPVFASPPIETPKQVLLLNGRVTTLVPAAKDKIGWTEARRRYTVNYLAKLQSLIRLNDWEIIVDFTPVNDDSDFETFAEITPALSARRATLRFGRRFFTIPSDEQRQTLLHEMIHLHLAAIHEMTSDTVTALTDERGFLAFDAAYDVAMEITTDGLADAFAPLLEPFDLPGR